MFIFFMRSMAFITRSDFDLSGSINIWGSTAGTTCHERPNRSLSQPHCCAFGSPPFRNG